MDGFSASKFRVGDSSRRRLKKVAVKQAMTWMMIVAQDPGAKVFPICHLRGHSNDRLSDVSFYTTGGGWVGGVV